jgi:beta-glucosidase
MSSSRAFPTGFVWGAATAAYQIEGATRSDGRGPSIWDAFSAIPGKTHAGDTGEIACDSYHRIEEDVALLKAMGLGAYRFSIAWPRVLPQGRGEPNAAGLRYYDRLIDALLAANIQPWVTLFHWDLPLALQLEQDGLLNPAIADHFAAYADLVFARYGDRVKHWITLNEPWCSAVLGHGIGYFPPGRVSLTEPYLAAHNLLRAHARIVALYRAKYQATQRGVIGITNNCDWREPATDTPADRAAAQRGLEFFLGWFADPVYFGDYPGVMRERVGERLPRFTAAERDQLTGSSDFFGLNHYTTGLAAEPTGDVNPALAATGNGGLFADQQVVITSDPAWPRTHMDWAIVPWGCRKLLEWIDDRYNHPPLYITENGAALPGEEDLATAQADTARVAFFRDYLGACHEALAAGVDLRGYFAWSLMDNFEWCFGYSRRFGLHHVDFATGRRTPKASAEFLGHVARTNALPA